MKNTLGNLLFIFLFIGVSMLSAQNQGITYQAVVRDDNGGILQNQNVTLDFEIIRNQANGPVVFTESATSTTDEFGLVNLIIGQQNSNQFAQIDWGDDSYFLKVSLNGTQIGGVREFQAVPYSKVATNMELDDLINVQAATAANGNVLVFQSGTWQPGDVESVVYTPGEGISIVGNVISNTAPDQTVVLNEGNNIDITGAYPNFTIASTATGGVTYTAGNGISINNNNVISNTAPDQTVVLNEGNNIDITGSYPNFTIAATVGGGNSLWSANGNNIFYDQGSISMGKNTAINGLNINNFQYLASGRLLDINLPVFVDGNMFVRHDFGDIRFGLSIQNDNDRSNVWTFHNSINPNDDNFDKNLLLVRNASIVAKISSAGVYATLSDARLKQNIRPLSNVVTGLTQLQAHTYSYIHDNVTRIGFLAQEVEKIFPEVVDYSNEHDLYMINYDAFGVLAVEAIKELNEKLSTQQTVIEQLQQRLNDLEQRLK